MKGIRAQLSHTHVAMTMTIMSTTSPPYISIMVVGMAEKLWIWFVILFLICYVFWIWDFLLLVILIFHFCISWFDYLLFLIVATFFGSCVFVFFAFSVQREVVIEKGRGSQIFSNPRRGSRFFFQFEKGNVVCVCFSYMRKVSPWWLCWCHFRWIPSMPSPW